jgi:hypothetical protein
MEIPDFGGKGLARIKEISNWVDRQLKPVKMTTTGLLRLGSRTPKKVLESGKFAPVLGCFDKAIVIASLLKDNGFQTSLVLQQVLQEGKPISCHFAVEATKGGKTFAVDPHPTRTDFYESPLPKEIRGKMSSPFKGKSDVIYKIVLQNPLPANHWNTKGFKMAGLKSGVAVLKRAGVKIPGFAAFSFGRITGSLNKRQGKKGSLNERITRAVARRKHR